ncbi:MAG: hypothetical protein Harvfovirus13_24 [Harvfovirus sp.]|uniref:Uncharacterized protein n=1 Tax=Harvfovirus sp. TaxID=2487768 RepID=A0A3G5A1C8_9VIRU|nr:MAG: hypothetical protein Harvfovirus13_24 [Harvfovirus sp.]
MKCENCQSEGGITVNIIDICLCDACHKSEDFRLVSKSLAKTIYNLSEGDLAEGELQEFYADQMVLFYEREIKELVNKKRVVPKVKKVETRGEKLDKILVSHGFTRTDFKDDIIENYLTGGRRLTKAISEKFREHQIKDAIKEHLSYLNDKYQICEAFIKGKNEIEDVRLRLEGIKWMRDYVPIMVSLENLLGYSKEDEPLVQRAIKIWIDLGRPEPNPPSYFSEYLRRIEVNAIQNKFTSSANNDFLTKENMKGYIDKIYSDLIELNIMNIISYEEYIEIAIRITQEIVFTIIRDDVVNFFNEKFVDIRINAQEIIEYDQSRISMYQYTENQLKKIIDRAIMDHNTGLNKKLRLKMIFERKKRIENALKCSMDACINLGSIQCIDLKCGKCCVNNNCDRHH